MKVLRLVFNDPLKHRNYTVLGSFVNTTIPDTLSITRQRVIAKQLYGNALAHERSKCVGFIVDTGRNNMLDVATSDIIPLWSDTVEREVTKYERS